MVNSSDPAPASPLPPVAVVVLVGPTATGKTDLSVELALRLDAEIINADSMQFYRGMDVGTAKIRPEEMRGVPHHLIDIFDLDTEASVADFQVMARRKILEVNGRGRPAILTGGSGLYVRAALDRLEFPPTDPQVRAEITEQVAELDLEQLRAELAQVDPASAEKMQDRRRMIRALEVHRITGRTFSSYLSQREYDPQLLDDLMPARTPILQLGLDMDRQKLNVGIEARVHRMIGEGDWLHEVARLRDQGLDRAPTASKAIGYRQLLAVLDGELSLEEAIEQTVSATRKFAKRQQTWFRADPRVHWLDSGAIESTTELVDQALAIINSAGSPAESGTL